jgi:hypothetical protein
LIIAVVSAITLSALSRSTTEVSLTKVDENAAQALRVAEGGAEQGLANLNVGTSIANVEVTKGGSAGFVSQGFASPGESAELTLVGSTGVTSIDIYWGKKNDSIEADTAAIEILKYQKFSAADYRTVVYAYDSNAARAAVNKFSTPTVNPGTYLGIDFGASVNIPIVAQDVLVRVKPLYNRATLGFSPLPASSRLTDQYYQITSTGVAGGNIYRKIQVASSSAGLPEVFDSTLYSGGALAQ